MEGELRDCWTKVQEKQRDEVFTRMLLAADNRKLNLKGLKL